MSVTYQETTGGIGPHDLQGFFVGWPDRPSPEDHLEILEGSDLLVLAVSKNRGVVGFIAAITDGVSTAHVTHLEVLPQWQRNGIGTELMRRMMLMLKTIRAVDLICDDDVQEFYERHGFKAARGMIKRRPPAQAR